MPQNRNFAAIFIFLPIIVAFLGWRYFRARNAPLTDHGMIREMKRRGESAVDEAKKKFNIELDYSPASVENVEAILAAVHDHHQKAPLAQTELTKVSLKWGAYIGEVIKIIRHSEWALDSKVGGAGSLPIVFDRNGGESFPVRWCYKRITDGPDENVWHKFQVLVVERDDMKIPPAKD